MQSVPMTNRMGPQTSGQAHPKPAAGALPADLSAVQLIDAKTAAAAGIMSVSWWHEKVAAGEAPQPAIRSPRCTRWRLADVVEFWRKFAERGNEGADVLAQARRASKAASAKRAARSAQAGR